jgi:hypothetical protein
MPVGRALVALALTGLAGCIFAVDRRSYGDHCAFAGSDTDCGRCLAERCQPSIDACCLDTACGGLIDQVEGCAQTQDGRCDAARAPAGGTDAQGQLAACLVDLCGGACASAPSTSSTSCAETRFGYGAACTCQPASAQLPANRFQCSAADVPSTRCCQPGSWPSPGTACSCLAVSCSPTSDGCSCFLSDSLDPSAVHVCEGTICCQGAQSCRCGSTACDTTQEAQVSRCDGDTTPCPMGSGVTAQCSLP